MTQDEMKALFNSQGASNTETFGIKVPPNCFVEMEGEMLAYEEGESLTARFPVLEKYQNPLGYMQGGFIAATIDNVAGAFTFLLDAPSVTTQMNVSYLRPITPDAREIRVRATLATRTKNRLFVTGEVFNEAGKVAAIAHMTAQLMGA